MKPADLDVRRSVLHGGFCPVGRLAVLERFFDEEGETSVPAQAGAKKTDNSQPVFCRQRTIRTFGNARIARDNGIHLLREKENVQLGARWCGCLPKDNSVTRG